MLPVPGSRVYYFWKTNIRGTSTRSMSGFDAAGTASTPSISGLYTCGYFHTRSISVWLLPALEVFRGSIVLNTACTWSISGSCTAYTLSTLSIKIILICAVYSEYEVYFDRLRTASTISSCCLAENFHRRSHEYTLEQITFVGSNWST